MDRIATKVFNWCNEHQKATAVILALALGLVAGVWVAR